MNTLSQEEIDQKALTLASQLVEFALAAWTSPDAIKALLEQLNIRDAKHQMYFLTALSMLVRNKMAQDFFVTPEAKENLVNAIQGVLDELIIRENEMEG